MQVETFHLNTQKYCKNQQSHYILFLTIHKEKPINSLDDIKNAFKINYSEVYFGLPIFCKGYYTKDNSVFTLTTNSGRRTAIRTTQAEEKNY